MVWFEYRPETLCNREKTLQVFFNLMVPLHATKSSSDEAERVRQIFFDQVRECLIRYEKKRQGRVVAR